MATIGVVSCGLLGGDKMSYGVTIQLTLDQYNLLEALLAALSPDVEQDIDGLKELIDAITKEPQA